MISHRFKITATINTFHNGSHIHLVAQNYATTDPNLATFLRRYPNVSYLGSETSKPAPIQPGQYPPCPEPQPVINGGLTAGGTAGINKIKRP